MREYTKKPVNQSRTLDSNPITSKQASISEILQAYKNGTLRRQPIQQKSVENENILQTKKSEQVPVNVILQRYKKSIQRNVPEEDEELLQDKFDTTQGKEIDEDELLQGRFESTSTTEQKFIQRKEKPNNTGLPDNLKTGIENLSGYSMDDVKVHYNSDKPAQLQALAYTQGTDIHVAPGQEKYLPHEAWHVVQQKQRRVMATVQLQDFANVNDDHSLEQEADVMGMVALHAFSKRVLDSHISEVLPIMENRTRVLQTKRINLRVPPRPGKPDTYWEVETSDQAFTAHIKNWIDASASTQPQVLRGFVREMQRMGRGNEKEFFLLTYARQVLSNTRTNLLNEDGDILIDNDMILRYRQDYTSNIYLNEADGSFVANILKLCVCVYTEHEGEYRMVMKWGQGNSVIHILHTGGNHYKALCINDQTLELSKIDSVSDGNCLIDAIYIAAKNKSAPKEFYSGIRVLLAVHMSDEHIENTLTTIVRDLSHGEQVYGLGPRTRERLQADSSLQNKIKSTPKPIIGSDDKTGEYYGAVSKYFTTGISRPEEFNKLPINVGEAEIEIVIIDGKRVPCIRVYRINFAPSVLSPLMDLSGNPILGDALSSSGYNEVQQDKEGHIVISTGKSANKPYKFNPEKLNPEKLKLQEDQLKTLTEQKDVHTVEKETGITKYDFATNEATFIRTGDKTIYMDVGRPDRALKWLYKYDVEKKKTKANPVIRSFLVPLDIMCHILSETVLQEESSKKSDKKQLSENSDYFSAPNQFGFSPVHVELLRKYAIPNSLVSYPLYPDRFKGSEHGQIRSINELARKIGIEGISEFGPTVAKSAWISGEHFREGKDDEAYATRLTAACNSMFALLMYYENIESLQTLLAVEEIRNDIVDFCNEVCQMALKMDEPTKEQITKLCQELKNAIQQFNFNKIKEVLKNKVLLCLIQSYSSLVSLARSNSLLAEDFEMAHKMKKAEISM